ARLPALPATALRLPPVFGFLDLLFTSLSGALSCAGRTRWVAIISDRRTTDLRDHVAEHPGRNRGDGSGRRWHSRKSSVGQTRDDGSFEPPGDEILSG